MCMCGQHLDTIEHCTWACPLYDAERAPALAIVNAAGGLAAFDTCFSFAALVNAPAKALGLGVDEVFALHSSLVDVWCARSRRWNRVLGPDSSSDGSGGDPPDNADENVDFPPPAAEDSDGPPGRDVGIPPAVAGPAVVLRRSGHELCRDDDSGKYYCRKCGWAADLQGKGDTAAALSTHFKSAGEYRNCPDEHATTYVAGPLKNSHRPHAIRKFTAQYLDVPVNGHELEWNGCFDYPRKPRGMTFDAKPYAPEVEGTLKCKRCDRVWQWVRQHDVTQGKPCSGSNAAVIAERAEMRRRIDEWRQEYNGQHDIRVDETRPIEGNTGRTGWICVKCRCVHGFNMATLAHYAPTACTRSADGPEDDGDP